MPNVIGVYNAKGTVMGELAYITKKILGLSKCALCEITHGWNIRGKSSWKQQCAVSPLTFSFLHLEELNQEQKQVISHFPAWIIHHNGQWIELMTAHEIELFQKDAQAMISTLEERFYTVSEE